MLKRLLALIIVALLAPVPTVWLFKQYGEWLFHRFQDFGIEETGSGLLAMLFVAIAGMVLIAAIAWASVFKEKQIVRWVKTGKLHA